MAKHAPLHTPQFREDFKKATEKYFSKSRIIRKNQDQGDGTFNQHAPASRCMPP
jgi:hypothetical protein